MKKSLSALKEKFGKFEISKEQAKKVSGGTYGVDFPEEGGGDGDGTCRCRQANYCTYIDPTDNGRHSVRRGNVNRDCWGMCC